MTIEQLIQQLNDSGNVVWEASLRQNTIVIWEMVGATALWFVCSVFGAFGVLWYRRTCIRRMERERFHYGSGDWRFAANMVGAIIGFWAVVMAIIWLVMGTDIFANPKWAAASRILGQFGGD